MIVSPYGSFQGATENRRKHEFDMASNECARINGFLNWRQTGRLLTPVPSMTVSTSGKGNPRAMPPGTGHTP